MHPVSLSIVLPCYNPPPGWLKNVETNIIKIQESIGPIELILVNDGSREKAIPEALETMSPTISFKLISYPTNQGKGYALRKGVELATGEFIVYTDIDFPYTHQSFLKIYDAIKHRQTDVAIGIRGEEYYNHLSRPRACISKLLRWFIKKFLRIPTNDTQCGLKGMNKKGKEAFIHTTISGYLFDLEFIYLAARKKLSIKTVEVEVRPEVLITSISWKILLQEFGNFLKIFIKSITN